MKKLSLPEKKDWLEDWRCNEEYKRAYKSLKSHNGKEVKAFYEHQTGSRKVVLVSSNGFCGDIPREWLT